ncbi:hypothetical protein [Thermithiobacillus plumbiphilus]|uniref:Uncharacterized protein n=1 Tax=Thermithiobacillus plumbiphilus TaxID=1729899 RepID=A0ABU9D6W7_9PROT
MPLTLSVQLLGVSSFPRRFIHHAPHEAWFRHLALDRSLSASTCRIHLAVRSLYVQVLKWPLFDVLFVVPKRAQRIPEFADAQRGAAHLGVFEPQAPDAAPELLRLRPAVARWLRVRDIDG